MLTPKEEKEINAFFRTEKHTGDSVRGMYTMKSTSDDEIDGLQRKMCNLDSLLKGNVAKIDTYGTFITMCESGIHRMDEKIDQLELEKGRLKAKIDRAKTHLHETISVSKSNCIEGNVFAAHLSDGGQIDVFNKFKYPEKLQLHGKAVGKPEKETGTSNSDTDMIFSCNIQAKPK